MGGTSINGSTSVPRLTHSQSSMTSTKSTVSNINGDDLINDLGLAGLQHHFDDFDYEAESNRLINSF